MVARPPSQQNWEQLLARLDRRVIYAALLVFTIVPLVARINLPVYVTPPVQNFYDAVEQADPNKIVFVCTNWDAGTYAENEPQNIGLFRHLLRRRLKFVIFSVSSANAPQMAQNALEEAIRAELPQGAENGYPQRGRDYVNAGFRVRNSPWVRSLVRNPVEALKSDWKGLPLAEMELFRGVEGLATSTSIFIDVSATNSTPLWISLIGSQKVRLALACTAVMAPEQYPYLATKQLEGMLTGMRGAAEYEKLLGYEKEGRATRMMGGQSFAHLFIFILILMGNYGIIRSWLQRRRAVL